MYSLPGAALHRRCPWILYYNIRHARRIRSGCARDRLLAWYDITRRTGGCAGQYLVVLQWAINSAQLNGCAVVRLATPLHAASSALVPQPACTTVPPVCQYQYVVLSPRSPSVAKARDSLANTRCLSAMLLRKQRPLTWFWPNVLQALASERDGFSLAEAHALGLAAAVEQPRAICASGADFCEGTRFAAGVRKLLAGRQLQFAVILRPVAVCGPAAAKLNGVAAAAHTTPRACSASERARVRVSPVAGPVAMQSTSANRT